MTDTKLLEEAIKKSGFRRRFISERLSISYQAFLNKVTGRSEFRASEISAMCALLSIDAEDRETIFFAKTVD